MKRLTGQEPFRRGGEAAGATLLDFWQWASSDLLGNTLRGVLAEYVVALDLGVASEGCRAEWDAHDLVSSEGWLIEVKSAAYLQSWKQKRPSRISFGIAPRKAWSSTTGQFGAERRRNADCYVFAVLEHRDPDTVDPLDLSQWRFFIVATRTLDEHFGGQKTTSLSSLKRIGPAEARFGEIRECLAQVMAPVGRPVAPPQGSS